MFKFLKVRLYKYIIRVFIAYLILIAILSIALYPIHRHSRLEQLNSHKESLGSSLSVIIAEDYEKVLDKDIYSEEYNRLRNNFKRFYESNDDLKYLYSFSKIDDKYKFVIAGSSEDFTPESFMFKMPFEDVNDIDEGIGEYGNMYPSINTINSDYWGNITEVYIPIFSVNNGELIGYIGMATNTSYVVQQIVVPYIIIVLCVYLLGNAILLAMFLVMRYSIIKPVYDLLGEINRIADYDFSHNDVCAEYMYRQDEIGELIRATAQMKINFVSFLNNLEFNARITCEVANSLIEMQESIVRNNSNCEYNKKGKCEVATRNIIDISAVTQELIAISQQSLDNIDTHINSSDTDTKKIASLLKEYNLKKERGEL